MSDLLVVWVVTNHPSDYPQHIVVRHQSVAVDGQIIPATVGCLFRTLSEARADLAGAGLTRLDRYPDDDPVIVEVWL